MPLPDLIEIVPLTAPVRAEITVPGSKSITNRALILAALADGETILEGALWSEDTQIMVECLQELGFMVNVKPDPNDVCNRTITVYGAGGLVQPGGTESQPLELFVGNAGTAARFLAPFLCLGSGVYRLHGVPRMHERPQAALFQALRELGYRIESENGNEKLPVRIFARNAGRLPESYTQFERRKAAHDTPQKCQVSIAESSQFASALLLCAKTGGWEIEIVGENADESPYVAMTTKLIEAFPQAGGKFQIEPDASSSSYFWGVTHALYQNVIVTSWPTTSFQIDDQFPRVFSEFSSVPGNDSVSRRTDLGDSIMTAITLSPLILTPFENATISFTDLGRLRLQECERVVALRTELTKCGAKVVEEGDTLTVWPSALHGAEIETYHDHRMAMCFAILGLKVPGIRIKNPACVKKTFPNFFQKLAAPPPHGLGAEIWEIYNGQRARKLRDDDLFAD